jgi:hypothetical protein
LAGLAGGCSKALPAAEANERRCYAGSLRRQPDQRPLGTLCLLDRCPRPFTAAAQRVLDLLAALVSQAIARRRPCLAQPRGGAEQGEKTRAQLPDELRELTVLVCYLFTRHGVQIPVPAERRAQVNRRLLDWQQGLTKRQC